MLYLWKLSKPGARFQPTVTCERECQPEGQTNAAAQHVHWGNAGCRWRMLVLAGASCDQPRAPCNKDRETLFRCCCHFTFKCAYFWIGSSQELFLFSFKGDLGNSRNELPWSRAQINHRAVKSQQAPSWYIMSNTSCVCYRLIHTIILSKAVSIIPAFKMRQDSLQIKQEIYKPIKILSRCF